MLSKGHPTKRKLAWTVIVLLGGALTIAMPRIKAYAKQKVYSIVQFMIRANRHDIAGEMDSIACEQTAQFVMENIPKVQTFHDRFGLMDYALNAVDLQN